MSRLEQTGATFATTRWSLVEALHDESNRRTAREELARIYWPAVYALARAKGLGQEHAAEAAQAFFAEVVVGRELFERASPDGGRLRSWVRRAFGNHLIDRARRHASRPDRATLPEGHEGFQPDDTGAAFDRAWAAAAISEATRRCQSHFLAASKPGHWSLFEARVLRPACARVEPPTLEHIAPTAGFASAADAAAALQTVRKRLLAILAEVVAETTTPDAAADEFRAIRLALST